MSTEQTLPPAVAWVVDAAREMARALRLVTAIGGALSKPGDALVAAVDALETDADPATERDFDQAAAAGVPVAAVGTPPWQVHDGPPPTHGTPVADPRAEADRWRQRAETAEARVDGHAWAELTAEAERLHIAGKAWQRRADDATADLDAALVTIDALREELSTACTDRDRYLAIVRTDDRELARVQDELATARRDAAAHVLEMLAVDWSCPGDVRQERQRIRDRAAEVRTGKRTIPSQPATTGADTTEET
jgi:hypothetical protein